jgi:hypothetical protein
MNKVIKYLFTLVLIFLFTGLVYAGDLGTGKGGSFKKNTFAKDKNFNKSGEGLIPPDPNNGSGGVEINSPIGGGMYLIIFGVLIYFIRRVRSDLKKDQNAEISL